MAKSGSNSKKKQKHKKVKIELDLDQHTINYLKGIADLAGTSIDDTVSVMLATHVINQDDGK